jgi:hypothetical protein
MKNLLKFISYLGLLLTVLPTILVLYRVITLETHYTLLVIGMALWFAMTPLWLGRKAVHKGQKDDAYG